MLPIIPQERSALSSFPGTPSNNELLTLFQTAQQEREAESTPFQVGEKNDWTWMEFFYEIVVLIIDLLSERLLGGFALFPRYMQSAVEARTVK